jgi:hypothetical protein
MIYQEELPALCRMARPFVRGGIALVLRLCDGDRNVRNIEDYFHMAECWLSEFRTWTGK